MPAPSTAAVPPVPSLPPSATSTTATAKGVPSQLEDHSSEVWDAETQQYHGGQDWKFLQNFREDFSVTTNGLGTPPVALDAARRALQTIDHYPPANQEPALSSLAGFLWPSPLGGAGAASERETHRNRLVLGNGASELIDLVVRLAPPGAWCSGPSRVQYMEYQRSAQSHGRAIQTPDRSLVDAGACGDAKLVCLVNPTNPTGDYMNLSAIQRWIEANVGDGATVTVDESMQLWLGPNWRQDSLVSAHAWIQQQFEQRNVSVYVIHSWTKIWSCTGIRLGSIVCPTAQHCQQLRHLQVPWSVNTPALAFLDQVVRDDAYLQETWHVTSAWRAYAIDALQQLAQRCGMEWSLEGEPFLSWIWIDMKDSVVAARAVQLAKSAGVPVRWAKYGYEMDTCVRIAVRSPTLTNHLVQAWEVLNDVKEF